MKKSNISKIQKSTSEKDTDHLFLTKWSNIFGTVYNTGSNPELFNNQQPDGWKIINNILFIIENKKEFKNKETAKNQLLKYLRLVKQNKQFEKFNKIYLIFGFGDEDINFNYLIYKYDEVNKKLVKKNKLLENIRESMELKTDFDEREIHKFNQYMYDNCNNFPKNHKTLFVAVILLTLNIDPQFLKDFDPNKKGFIIANKMLELIQNQYNDETFTNQFLFLKNSLQNKYLYDLINKITIDVKKYSKDILNKFYSEFCVWDKNNDPANGVVLTPHDIVELMVKELNITSSDTVLDFCTGTGSFLLEAGKYSKNLFGCEYNEERYTLCQCNFILNEFDYKKVYHNSCFNQEFLKVDKSIINPPFSCKCIDENVKENITNWKSYNEEQRFLLYQVQCLKIGGLGACIIPRSNFNNSSKNKQDIEFKKELLKHIQILKIINCNNKVFVPNATVECAIIIYQRIKSTDKPYISKNVKIIDYSNDGFEIRKKLRIKISEPKPKEQIRNLNYTDDWNFKKELEIPDNLDKMIQIYNSEYNNTINKINIMKLEPINMNQFNINKYKLSDLFEVLKIKTFITNKTTDGDIPLYGATQLNNPVKFINDYSIDTNEYNDLLVKRYGVFCINKTGDGGAGISFIRKGRFALNSTVICCKMKINITLDNAAFISYQLHNNFNHSNSLNSTKFNEIEVYLLDDDITLYNKNELKQWITETFKVKEWKQLNIKDNFDIINVSKIFQINNTINGFYPLISSKGFNNGISKYINDYSYEGDCISIARNGTVGSCFVQNGKFGITTDIILLKPKNNNKINLHIWTIMINYYLTKKYSYSNKLTIEKLLNEIINIPIFE